MRAENIDLRHWQSANAIWEITGEIRNVTMAGMKFNDLRFINSKAFPKIIQSDMSNCDLSHLQIVNSGKRYDACELTFI